MTLIIKLHIYKDLVGSRAIPMESSPELVASVDTEPLRPGGPCTHWRGPHTHLACGCHHVSGPWTLVTVPGTLLCILHEVSV